jgi:fucose permease
VLAPTCGTANSPLGFSRRTSPSSDSKDVLAVPPLLLSCLAYLTLALPSSALGLLWPSMQLSFHAPVGALGVMLIFGTTASVISSAATGRILSRVTAGPLLPLGTLLIALALGIESAAPSLWVFTAGTMVFGSGFGAIDSALNAHAASHFGARDVNWMHASFGLGSAVGPLLVTVLLSDGLGWRRTYGIMGAGLAALALVFLLSRRSWPPPSRPRTSPGPAPANDAPRQPRLPPVVLATLLFTAVECGIEAAAGIWGYVFLTSGRALSPAAAGVAVAAYWAMMFVGRAVLGPVAERAGPTRVLSAAVAGIALGAVVMSVPGPGFVAVTGLMTVGLAAAPVFPLLTVTTAQRAGPATSAPTTQTTRTVSLQVAASTAGSAALPAVLGLAIGALHAGVLAPALLLLSLVMWALYALLSRSTRSPGQESLTRTRTPRSLRS